MIAIEYLFLLIGGIVLVAVLTAALVQLPGRGGEAARQGMVRAVVRLVRETKWPGDYEETRLLINDRVILTASSEGLRPADYADAVEQLESIATHIGAALGISVELARMSPQPPGADEGVPVRDLLRRRHDSNTR